MKSVRNNIIIGKAINKIFNNTKNFVSLSSVISSEEDGNMYEDLCFTSVDEIIEWYQDGKKKKER